LEKKKKFLKLLVAVTMLLSYFPAELLIKENQASAASTYNGVGWTNDADVPVSIVAGTDSYSGVNRIDYRLTGATNKGLGAYGGTFNVTAEGVTNIEAYTVDNAGNLSPLSSSAVRIDRTPPNAPTFKDTNSNYRNTDVSVELVAGADTLSGSARVEYRIDAGVWQTYTAPFIINASGSALVEARTVDNAGNMSVISSMTYKIDKLKPSAPSVLRDNTGWADAVTFTINKGFDLDSGINRSEFSYDGVVWNNYVNPVKYQTEGTNKIYFRSVDNAGNYSDIKEEEFTIDHSGPSATVMNLSSSEWVSDKVGLEIIPGVDALSGVEKTEWSLDDGEWKTYQGALEFTDEGIHIVKSRSVDNVGNNGEVSQVTFKIDKKAPTAPELAINPVDWTKDVATVIITAGKDEESGIKETEYSINGSEWKAYDQPFPVDTEGEIVIKARSVDKVGNAGPEAQVLAKIDKTAPDVPEVYSTAASWTNKDVTVTALSSLDKLSGFKRLKYSEDGTSWKDYLNPIEITREGVTNLLVRAEDNAGNFSESAKVDVKIDRTAPNSPLVAASEKDWTNKVPVSIALTGEGKDEASGVNHNEYSIEGGDWIAYDQPLEVSKEGVTSVAFRTIDNAGNVSQPSYATAMIDLTAPTVPGIKLSDTEFVSKDVEFKIDGSTDLNPVRYQYSVDGGEFVDGNSGVVTADGTHTLSARAIDSVGNISEVTTITVYVDKSAPTIKLTPDSRDWSPSKANVEVAVADTGSGVDKVFYRITDSSQIPTSWDSVNSDNLSIESEGVWYVHLKAIDKAGNTTQVTSGAIKLQNVPEAPKNIRATGIGEDNFTAEWDLPQAGTYTDGWKYKIEVIGTGKEEVVDFPISSVKFSGLAGGRQYSVRVTAMNHVGSSYDDGHLLTLPAAPENIRVEKVDQNYNSGFIYVSKVEGATAYHIFVRKADSGEVIVDDTTVDTTYPFSGMTPGTNYDVNVSAINSTGEGISKGVRFLSLPDNPGEFKSVNVFTDKILLSWNSVSTALKYNLLRDGNQISSANVLNFLDEGLSSGTAYDYSVGAVNDTGLGAYSHLRGIRTLPAAISGITVEGISQTGATLKWNGVKGASEYVIRNGSEVSSTNDTSWVLKDLKPGERYDLTIAAKNESGEGELTPVSFITIPAEPASVKVEEVEEDSAVIKWDLVNGATGYTIEVDGKEYAGNTGEIKVAGLVGSKNYIYKIKASNSSGSSQWVEGKFVTKPHAVNNLAVDNTDTTSLNLVWDKDDTVTKYTIKVKDTAIIESSSDPSAPIQGLEAGTNYDIIVRGENSSGVGKESIINWTTKTSPIDKISSVTDITYSDLKWDAVKGAEKYYISDRGGNILYAGTDTQTRIKGLSGGTPYNLVIWSTNDKDVQSGKVEHSILTKPSSPQLSVDKLSAHSASIAVNFGSNLVDQYVVYVNGKEVLRSMAWQKIFTVEDLMSASTYNITVLPVNSTGEGETTSLTILTATESVKSSDVKVTPKDDNVVVEFPTVDGAKDYVIVDKDGKEVWRGKESPATVEGLTPGTQYDWELVVENQQGTKSEATPIKVLTLPSKPILLKGTATKNDVTLDLSEVRSLGATEYIIYRGGKEIAAIPSSQFKYVDKELISDTEYQYEVRGKNVSGLSITSACLTIKTDKERKNSGDGADGGTIIPPKVETIPTPEVVEEVKSETTKKDSLSDQFSDIDETFSRDEINKLATQGILKGTAPNIFEPDRPVTRMEFAALIVRAIDATPDESVALTFKDINRGAWYTEELKAALATKVAKGFSNIEFRPNIDINREQASKMLVNVLKEQGVTAGSKSSDFTDADRIIGWAKEDVDYASSVGLVGGYPDGSFGPKNSLTRAESAALIYRMIEMIDKDGK
jgi:hypothetical protein